MAINTDSYEPVPLEAPEVPTIPKNKGLRMTESRYMYHALVFRLALVDHMASEHGWDIDTRATLSQLLTAHNACHPE
jgi:hypothetical protein